MKTLFKKGLGLFLAMAMMVSVAIPVGAESIAQGDTKDVNFGAIEVNEGTVSQNGTNDNHANAVIGDNKGTVDENAGVIAENNGTVDKNVMGEITNNNAEGRVSVNGGLIKGNYGAVDKNGASLQEAAKSIITTNRGNVNENNGTVVDNGMTGVITTNKGTVGNSTGTVTTNNGTVEKNIFTGVVGTNNGTVGQNGGAVTNNAEDGVITLNGDRSVTEGVDSMKVETNNGTVAENAALVVENKGTVTTNLKQGIVASNDGQVMVNDGTVTSNKGMIKENNGIVEENQGTVLDNTGSVTLTGSGTLVGNMIAADAEGNSTLKQNVTIGAAGGQSQTYHAVTVVDSASETNMVVQFLENVVTKLVDFFTRDGYTLLGYAGTEGKEEAEVAYDAEVTVTNPMLLFTVWKKNAVPEAAPVTAPESAEEAEPEAAPAPVAAVITAEEKQEMAETAAAKIQEVQVDKLVTSENAAVKYEVAAVVAEGKSEIVITAKEEANAEVGVVSLNLEKTLVAELVEAEVENVRFVVGEQEVSVSTAALNQVLAENADAQIVVAVDPVTGNVVVYLLRNGQKIDITDRFNLRLTK